MKRLIFGFCLTPLVTFALELPETRSRPQILFQGFGWDCKVNDKEGIWYEHLGSLAEDLKNLGVTMVWFPPVSRSVSPQGYMPGDYYDLGTPENKTFYGDLQSLKTAIDTMHKNGLEVIADVVINHRTASHQESGIWNVFHHQSGKMLWERWALTEGDYGGSGKKDSGDDFPPAPDLDHSNHRVRADISSWLNWMKDFVGFDGWRFDYTKGFDGIYVKEYTEKTKPSFCVGEYWTSMDYEKTTLKPDQNGHRQKAIDWIDRTKGKCQGFDFTTKGILQVALASGEYWRLRDNEGKASGMLGWWPEKSVTFLDNHDTGSKQAHWPFPENKLAEGYAYILTHPGTPAIFYEHLYQNQELAKTIRELAKIRLEAGIESKESLKIIEAKQNLYIAQIGEKLLVKLGSSEWKPSEAQWKLKLNGPGFLIWGH